MLILVSHTLVYEESWTILNIIDLEKDIGLWHRVLAQNYHESHAVAKI
jgi:hypothetical protein